MSARATGSVPWQGTAMDRWGRLPPVAWLELVAPGDSLA